MTWYKTGTVSVVQNSNAVIGTGTAFIANGRVGDAFQGPDGDWYEVTNIASDTAMAIAPNYGGGTAAGAAYSLAPMQGYNKDTADALRKASLQIGSALDGLEEALAEAESSASTATSAKNEAQASAAAAAGSASAANTSKNDAAASATASASSATSSAGSAVAANSSKAAAAQSETNAGTSAGNSASSATAAAASASAAAASAGTAASLGVGMGYIDGLAMTWSSATSIAIGAGSAYVPSVAKVVQYAGGTITPGAVVDVNSFIHLYLTATGTIEQSLSAPVRYYNQAHQKTGDNTRRYIGSLHVTTNVAGVTKFVHHPIDNSIMYTLANPQGSPFQILAGGTSIAAFSTAAIVPVTAHTLHAAWQNAGTASVSFTPSDAGTSVTTGWMVFVAAGQLIIGRCPLSAIDRTLTYRSISGASANCYGLGYYFDR